MALNFNLARKRRRWLERTQDEIGVAVGVTGQTISRWENGEREPRSSELKLWARALGLAPAELLSEPDAESSTEPEPAGKGTAS